MSELTFNVTRALNDSVIEFKVRAPETQFNGTPEEGLEVLLGGVDTIIERFMQRRNCFKFHVTLDGVFQVFDLLLTIC